MAEKERSVSMGSQRQRMRLALLESVSRERPRQRRALLPELELVVVMSLKRVSGVTR